MRRFASLLLVLPSLATAQGAAPRPPALDAIRVSDIRRDIDYLGGDAMRGREAGTLDELRASVWIADQLRAIGLAPAGEDGSFFQWWPMRRMRLSDASTVAIDGRPLAMGRDVIVSTPMDQTLDLPVVFVGEGQERDLANVDVSGKAVVALVTRPANAPAANVSLSSWRYAGLAVRTQSRALIQRGAAAVLLVADSISQEAMPFYGAGQMRGSYGLGGDEPTNPRPKVGPPVMLVSRSVLDAVKGAQRLALHLSSESFTYPSVNIVAKVAGTDPKLRDEYVLFSSHQDHDGVRYPMNGDSIWNGADDNASVSVGLLAIARAWKAHPGKRSVLFVYHGAEERGLLGSKWHAAHPVVPKESIVAVLNADMIGRNDPDSASLLGVQPPHRNSPALAAAALRANDMVSKFSIDSLWDRPTHPEGWYFRSDHLPYAHVGIPAIMFSTLPHADYHTPRDEPSRIDVNKLARVAKWMYATGWLISETRERPALDPTFKLER